MTRRAPRNHSTKGGRNVEGTDFNLEDRVLCSDDACIGTVGQDGRCKVCGKPYEGDAEISAKAAPEATNGERPVEEAPCAATASADADSERVCCPDDACIGIIGSNGKCGVCGKSG